MIRRGRYCRCSSKPWGLGSEADRKLNAFLSFYVQRRFRFGCYRNPNMKRGRNMTLAATGASEPSGASDNKIWQVILAAAVGTIIEWYDIFIFSSLTAVPGLQFYPPGNATFPYLASPAPFADALAGPPFGGLFL